MKLKFSSQTISHILFIIVSLIWTDESTFTQKRHQHTLHVGPVRTDLDSLVISPLKLLRQLKDSLIKNTVEMVTEPTVWEKKERTYRQRTGGREEEERQAGRHTSTTGAETTAVSSPRRTSRSARPCSQSVHLPDVQNNQCKHVCF